MTSQKLFISMILIVALFWATTPVDAGAFDPIINNLFIDQATISKGYTITSMDQVFRVGLTPDVLNSPTEVVTKQLSREMFDFPEGFESLSDVYEFDVKNKEYFNDEKPVWVTMRTFRPETQKKRIYFWNGVDAVWQELPSASAGDAIVKAAFHLPYARLVVLTRTDSTGKMEFGQASWYAYKDCDCAASPDYPKGSLLKVTNLDNDKSIIVRVNDFGPERNIFPERVIDLDKVAFSQIGSTRMGILPNVRVELEKLAE